MLEVRGKNWDQYWRDSKTNKGLFEVIAKFYRRYVISPSVRYFFRKYFADEKGRIYLHAGCGSAESDNRIGFEYASFVLMDISTEALAIAKQKSSLKNIHYVCGDIFNPPFKTETIDGLWNLGVLEHFHESEIRRILESLARILAMGGKGLIFWPPKYGLSVIVLTSFLNIVNSFRKAPLVLYPDEVSRFSSIQWIRPLVNGTGLTVERTHFGIRDAFTYVVLVVTKSQPRESESMK